MAVKQLNALQICLKAELTLNYRKAKKTMTSEKEYREVEMFRNIERLAAWQLRKEGHVQSIIWKAK